MADSPPSEHTPFTAAKNLSRRQFRRYIEALEVDAALERGDQPPSALGRFFKPAETERKLVLFTLGILVTTIVAVVFVIEMWGADGDASRITSPLVTLAGTGLGFIGGMVADVKRSDARTRSSPPTPPQGDTAPHAGAGC